jgi:hypothetical protein
MKKLFLSLLASLFASTISFGQQSITLKSIASESEFKELDEIDQAILSSIDASVFALKGLSLNNEFSKKKAVITLAMKEKSLSNTITIEDQGSGEPLNAQSCTICDFFSGMMCFRKVREELQHGTVIIRVESVRDCAVLTWN